ncbi:MAG: hypothetical protein ACYDAH_17630 [Steroidobacteraceae bacterium]
MFSVVVSPAASTLPLNETRKFRALPRDRSRRRVVDDLQFAWRMLEGEGALQGITDQEVEYRAPAVPGLARSLALTGGGAVFEFLSRGAPVRGLTIRGVFVSGRRFQEITNLKVGKSVTCATYVDV